jgi:hypothetical protein
MTDRVRLLAIIAGVIICFGLASCSWEENTNENHEENIIDNYEFLFSDDGINVISSTGDSNFTISNFASVADSLYFTINEMTTTVDGDASFRTLMFAGDLLSPKVALIFSEDLLSSYEDKIYIKGNTLLYINPGYSLLRALNIDNYTEIEGYEKPVDMQQRIYSPDLEFTFDSSDSGIYVQSVATESQKVHFENLDDTYASVNWSQDSTRVVCIATRENAILSLDTTTMTSQRIENDDYMEALRGLDGFADYFVDLSQCFTNYRGNIAVTIICTEASYTILWDSEGNYKNTVSTDRDVLIFAMDNDNILYATKNDGVMGLYIYDLASATTEQIKTEGTFDYGALTEDYVFYSGKDIKGDTVLRRVARDSQH